MGAHHDQIKAFAHYNRAFNARLFDLIATLDDRDRRRDLGAFFGSVHGTLNHILLADRIWLGRFAAAFPRLTALHGAALLTRFDSLRDELYADFDALRSARADTDGVIVAWAEQMTDPLLAETMRYANSQGQTRSHPAWIAAAHLFNHQTHHRGQITTLLHQLGHDPGVTDFIAYVG